MILIYKIIKAMNKQVIEQLCTIFVKQEHGTLNEIIIQRIFNKQKEALFHTECN